MLVGMVLLAPFYHPLLLAEQIGTLSAFVDAPIVVTFASGGAVHAFERFGYRIGSRGARSEEMIPVVRALLAGETVTAAGQSFDIQAERSRRYPAIRRRSGSPARTRSPSNGRDGSAMGGSPRRTRLTPCSPSNSSSIDAPPPHTAGHSSVLRRDVYVAESDDAARTHVDPILEQGYRGVDYGACSSAHPTRSSPGSATMSRWASTT